jgi:hypothetical protein
MSKKTRKTIKLTRSHFATHSGGRKKETTRNPSRGGMGIRLKMASPIFKTKPILIIWTRGKAISRGRDLWNPKDRKNLYRMSMQIAKSMLARGPAAATKDIPEIGFLKWRGSTGTGFAQPIKEVKRIQRVPVRDRWAKGLKVSLPSFLAVGSPSL